MAGGLAVAAKMVCVFVFGWPIEIDQFLHALGHAQSERALTVHRTLVPLLRTQPQRLGVDQKRGRSLGFVSIGHCTLVRRRKMRTRTAIYVQVTCGPSFLFALQYILSLCFIVTTVIITMSLFAGGTDLALLTPARTQAQLLKECQDNARFWQWMFWGFIIALGIIFFIWLIVWIYRRSNKQQQQPGQRTGWFPGGPYGG